MPQPNPNETLSEGIFRGVIPSGYQTAHIFGVRRMLDAEYEYEPELQMLHSRLRESLKRKEKKTEGNRRKQKEI